MIVLIFTSLLVFMIIFILLITIFILQGRTSPSKDKFSPFECGFSQLGSGRLPFSTRYFLLTVVFLVFDVELVLLFPLINLLTKKELSTLLMTCSIFVILLSGVLYEWKEGSFQWMK
uniref:NADH-ubiquinone oxidoreductase chain 3 n=1 Tax=Scutopus ventrolineatus TaxID=52922 RepID=A0A096XEB9_SCUVE|nr:NADH dehydrogenase subunit 3 [Scutopus ventrolineatus]AHI45704.1 NADH dehydrogenase subunit 3 [Scutopus ventrolineatus]